MSSNGSKKKANKAAAANKPAETKQPSKKNLAVIIAAVAIIIVAAIAVCVYFFGIKPKQADTAATTIPSAQELQASEFELVEYRDGKMPKIFAEILNQAKEDSSYACKEYGVAMSFGDRAISVPEYLRYYYETCYNKTNESFQATLSGVNSTGYVYSRLPSEQKPNEKSQTWSQIIADNTVDEIQSTYTVFDAAVSAGTTLDQSDLYDLYDYCMSIHKHAENKSMTVDQLISKNYCDGLSLQLFASRFIMAAYNDKYRENVCNKFKDDCPDDMIDTEYSKNIDKYMLINARIAPIEDMEYDPAEFAKVRDEKTYVEYVQKENEKYIPGYDAAIQSLVTYVDYETIDSRLGGSVAQWIFDPARKVGDLAMLQGEIYPCAVLIKEPARLTCSFDYHAILVPFNSNYGSSAQSDEEKTAAKQLAQSYYDEWKKGAATLESFDALCAEKSPEEDIVYHNSRASESPNELAIWALNDNRKPGDCEVLEVEHGYCVAYFIKKNTDDPDWLDTYLTQYSGEMYSKKIDDMLKNVPTHKNSAGIQKALTRSDELCSSLIDQLNAQMKSLEANQ